jgi:hypothetical protein
MKRTTIFHALSIIVILSLFLAGQAPTALAKSAHYAYPNVGGPAVRQSIVYQPPKLNGTLLGPAGVVNNFEMLIYARSHMLNYLKKYKQAGWHGLSLLYFDVAKNNGPKGLSSLAAQKTLCTSAQKTLPVYSNTITMDTGEMCRIHDAIIRNGTVDGLPVTEAWFLHRSDGSRYEVAGGGGSGAAQYRMNFAHPDFQQYYLNKLRREFEATDPNHLPTGAMGLFLDNISESWSDIEGYNNGAPPREFADKAAYQAGMESFLAAIRAEFPAIQIWGNMTSFSTNEENFVSFKPYLDGAMIEGAFLDWDGNPRSVSKVEDGNTMADAWGKPLLYVVQGNSSNTYHKYTFGLYLLMVNDDAYFFFSDQSSYANFYRISEYQLALGKPLGKRAKIGEGIWRRRFENGVVRVNLNTQTTTITMTK